MGAGLLPARQMGTIGDAPKLRFTAQSSVHPRHFSARGNSSSLGGTP